MSQNYNFMPTSAAVFMFFGNARELKENLNFQRSVKTYRLYDCCNILIENLYNLLILERAINLHLINY